MGKDGKIGFFFRGAPGAMGLSESQLYAQYPDVDIVRIKEDPFAISEDEEVISMDLIFREPEVFPIKRHPQFDDILSRVNVDPIAGITSTLARYDEPGMRGHIQIALKPMSIRWRRRAIRFLPLLSKGLSAMSNTYQRFFTRFQLARGWRRLVYLIPAN